MNTLGPEAQRRHSIIAGMKKVVLNRLELNLPSVQLTDWLLVEVALLLIGLTKIF
jgi:hypothetical protein